MEKQCLSIFHQIDPYEEECFIFEGNCSPPDHLFSTQEEAETRLKLHAQDASLNYQDIIIHTSDTDVFILAIAMWVIETKIFIKTGNQSKLRLINGRWLMGSIIKIKLAYAKHS